MNYRSFTQKFARNQAVWAPCSSLPTQGLGSSLSLGSYSWINCVIMCVNVFKLRLFKSNLIKIQKAYSTRLQSPSTLIGMYVAFWWYWHDEASNFCSEFLHVAWFAAIDKVFCNTLRQTSHGFTCAEGARPY